GASPTRAGELLAFMGNSSNSVFSCRRQPSPSTSSGTGNLPPSRGEPSSRITPKTWFLQISYLGGFGCDFIRNYPQNNFVEFQSGMDPTNPNATKTASITVGPGKAVAIAGSDCFFGDNFTFHTLVK